MNVFVRLQQWWDGHGTKLLGTAAVIVNGLQTISGLIPEADKPYWAAAGVVFGALTINRGFSNSKVQS